MDEITVTAAGSEESSPSESAAHDAAVSEGASAVHAGNAESAADEAHEAAETTAAIAQQTIAAASAAVESAERAEAAQEATGVTMEAIHSAMMAQSDLLGTLLTEIRDSRAPAPPPEPEISSKPDKAPRKRHWYYGG